jgi:hypothetical protein
MTTRRSFLSLEGLLPAAASGSLIRDLPDAVSTGDGAVQRQPAGTGW